MSGNCTSRSCGAYFCPPYAVFRLEDEALACHRFVNSDLIHLATFDVVQLLQKMRLRSLPLTTMHNCPCESDRTLYPWVDSLRLMHITKTAASTLQLRIQSCRRLHNLR